ncbi:MAG TPA: branched-chain amino acid ABC transporter substrate-binding protein [Gaiellaceae bacterium]|nr:branched-chain amino acid ABC transporter substrate-binding protein [Gaiellaceae bacterium]
MLKKVVATAAIAALVAAAVAATLGGTASAKVAKTSPLCKTAGLGYGGPLSGGASFLGDDQSNWEKLFINSWNAGKAIPGVPKKLHRVKLTLANLGDSTLNAQKAATVAQKMVSFKNILGMVGFAGSNENLGGGPILDAAHLAYVSGSATLDTLATGTKGQKPLKYFFRVVPVNAIQAKTVPFMITHLKLKKGQKVLVVDDGEAYGIGLANDAQAIFKSHGLKVTRKSVKETDNNPGGSTGFAADIAPVALLGANTGFKFVYAPTQDAGDSQVFTNDLKTDGYNGPFMATDGSVDPTHFHTVGAYLSFFGPAITAINKKFESAYRKAYGASSASDPFGAPSFVATQMLATAISEECAAVHGKLWSNLKTARGAVAAKLKKVKLSTTILGFPVSFNKKDAFHGPASGATLFQIQAGGKYKELYAVK